MELQKRHAAISKIAAKESGRYQKRAVRVDQRGEYAFIESCDCRKLLRLTQKLEVPADEPLAAVIDADDWQTLSKNWPKSFIGSMRPNLTVHNGSVTTDYQGQSVTVPRNEDGMYPPTDNVLMPELEEAKHIVSVNPRLLKSLLDVICTLGSNEESLVLKIGQAAQGRAVLLTVTLPGSGETINGLLMPLCDD